MPEIREQYEDYTERALQIEILVELKVMNAQLREIIQKEPPAREVPPEIAQLLQAITSMMPGVKKTT